MSHMFHFKHKQQQGMYIVVLMLVGFFATVFVVSENKKQQEIRSHAAEEETTPTATESGQIATPSATVTIAPGNTSIELSLLVHGIGKGGDSSNPSSSGSAQPLHPDREVDVEIFDSSNQLVSTKSGTVTYASSSGGFNGSIDLGPSFQSGSHTVKVKIPQSLKTLVDGIQVITAGSMSAMPTTILITGDINDDNFLNILDYNLLNGCFSDLLPAQSCTDADKILADLTDDGAVNQFDYNLFIREILNQAGR